MPPCKRPRTAWRKNEFSTFKRRLAEDDLPDDSYSYDVEQDYWEWEEAETLKAHYQQVQTEWT